MTHIRDGFLVGLGGVVWLAPHVFGLLPRAAQAVVVLSSLMWMMVSGCAAWALWARKGMR